MAGAGEMRKFLCQNTNTTREENSKVAFESHYEKKIYSYGRKTNKNKLKAQQIGSRIFRKLQVTSAFPFETKKGNVLAMHTAPFRAEWQCSLHVSKELSGFVYTLLTGSKDSSEKECCQRVEQLIKSSSQDFQRKDLTKIRLVNNSFLVRC